MGIAFGSKYVDFDHINTLNSSATYNAIITSPSGLTGDTSTGSTSNSSSGGSGDRLGSKRKNAGTHNSSSKRYTARSTKGANSTSVSPSNSGSPASVDSNGTKRSKSRVNKLKTPPPTNTGTGAGADGSFRSPSGTNGTHSVSPEGENPKIRCNCRKTKCIKLYCDCFRVSKFCEGCNCIECSNTGEKEAERKSAISGILERNPDAFAPRIKEDPNSNSKGHLSGCHCKKSACLKKYCECFSANVACSEKCRCLDCKNSRNNDKGGGVPETGTAEVSPLSTFDVLSTEELSAGGHDGEVLAFGVSDAFKEDKLQGGHLKAHKSLLEDDMLSILS
eukprot:GSChrysophyteH2.ASY1.ANO1.371.1 assembled CDS